MAKQVANYVSVHGVNFPKSYWKVMALNLVHGHRTAEVVVHAFADSECAAKGKANIDARVYRVNTSDYEKYFMGEHGTLPIKQAYAILTDTKDCMADGSQPKSDQLAERSFFSGALDV